MMMSAWNILILFWIRVLLVRFVRMGLVLLVRVEGIVYGLVVGRLRRVGVMCVMMMSVMVGIVGALGVVVCLDVVVIICVRVM